MLLGARNAMGGGKALPYEQLPYLMSNGDSKCVTDIYMKSTYEISVKASWDKNYICTAWADNILSGRYYAGSSLTVAATYLNTGLSAYARIRFENNGNKDVFLTNDESVVANVRISKNGCTINGDPIDMTYNMNDTYRFYLSVFGTNSSRKIRLHEIICSENGVELYHYIPVVRNEDNTVCLYDLVNDVYKPSTTSPFLAP